jgi:hypothetical protein
LPRLIKSQAKSLETQIHIFSIIYRTLSQGESESRSVSAKRLCGKRSIMQISIQYSRHEREAHTNTLSVSILISRKGSSRFIIQTFNHFPSASVSTTANNNNLSFAQIYCTNCSIRAIGFALNGIINYCIERGEKEALKGRRNRHLRRQCENPLSAPHYLSQRAAPI